MVITILTLFPKMFTGPFEASIVKRAKDKHLVDIRLVNIRDFAHDSYKTVDDHPYGGGHGMILRVDIIDAAISNTKAQIPKRKRSQVKTILLDPQGTPYSQKKAQMLSQLDHLILLCGHYEGVDERVRLLVDEEISVGDYILSGGEIPAMTIVDSVVRLIPGVLQKEIASQDESFSPNPHYLEYPQYTRPATYKSMDVPGILLSGDHNNIRAWKERQANKRIKKRRPDPTRFTS